MTSRGLLLAGGTVFMLAMVLGMARPETTKIDGPFADADLIGTEYLVSGGDLAAVERSIARKRPSAGWGRTWPHWSWDADCNVTLRIKVTMPKLSGRWRLSSQELRIWDDMIAALWAHEMRHVEIATDAARQIKEAHCAPDLIAQITRQHDRTQARYDRQTGSGALEGVTLRP